MKSSLIVFFSLLFINILFMPNEFYGGAAKTNYLEAQHLLKTGSIGIDKNYIEKNIPKVYFNKKGAFFSQNPKNQLWYSRWSLPNSLIYIPPLLIEAIIYGKLHPINLKTFELHTNSLLVVNLYWTLLATVFGFLLFKLLSLNKTGQYHYLTLGFTLFSTFTWNYLRAQGHDFTLSFLYLFFFYFWIKREWFPTLVSLSLLTIFKFYFFPLFFMVLFFDRHLFFHNSKNLKTLFFSIMSTFIFLILQNYLKFGFFLDFGYNQEFDVFSKEVGYFSSNPIRGLFGFLIDPRGSIFWYFPIIVFVIMGLRDCFQKKHTVFLKSVLPFLFFLLFFSFKTDYLGEWCYGPRYLLPFLVPLTLIITYIKIENKFTSKFVTMLYCLIGLTFFYFNFQFNSFAFYQFYLLRNQDSKNEFYFSRPQFLAIMQKYKENPQNPIFKRNFYWNLRKNYLKEKTFE